MKTGAQLIAEERERQISQEGWTPAHDDTHSNREMAAAAAGYLEHYVHRSWLIDPRNKMHGYADPERYREDAAEDIWPDDWADWWKPKDMLSDLVRAGALVAAEIDRRQRESVNAQDQRPRP